MKINIKDIHKEILILFKKYKFPWLAINLPMQNLHSWAYATAKRLNINKESFKDNVSELFWTLSHVQISLGNVLIARQSCKFPKGTKGFAFSEKDIPNMIELPEMHFWHHIFCSIECIYRFWERVSIIIRKVCYPGCSEKLYFDGLIKKLSDDPKFNMNLNKLKKQVKKWNSLTAIRNALSHKASSPFGKTSIEGDVANILGPNEEIIFKLTYSSENLVEEINKVKDKYLELLPLALEMKEFIDRIKINS